MPDIYKTEEQLKAEALARRKAEAETAAANPKTVSQKKRENFWYHYKWHTIGGIFFALIVIFFIKDTFLSPTPDATIVLVSDKYVSEESIEELAAEIENVASEDGGNAYILIDQIILSGDGSDYASMMKLTAVISAGFDSIFLLDNAAYNYIFSMGEDVFVSEGIPADGFLPELEGMSFYLRTPTGKNQDNYEYCEYLLGKIEGRPDQ